MKYLDTKYSPFTVLAHDSVHLSSITRAKRTTQAHGRIVVLSDFGGFTRLLLNRTPSGRVTMSGIECEMK